LALEGDSTDKEHLALPFICGMLPLIGGQSVTPFFQPRRAEQPSIALGVLGCLERRQLMRVLAMVLLVPPEYYR
jgi:hypothetical protein